MPKLIPFVLVISMWPDNDRITTTSAAPPFQATCSLYKRTVCYVTLSATPHSVGKNQQIGSG